MARARANSGRQEKPEARNGKVRVRSRNRPRRGWSPDEALDLLRQGYEIEHVSERTGFAVPWLSAQPVPRQALALRTTAAKIEASRGKSRNA